MRIDAQTPIWVVTDPTPQSTLPDVCFKMTLDGLRLQFAGGLSMDQRPALFTTRDEAHEEAKNRLLVSQIARQIRIDRRVAQDEVVRVTLHDKDGAVLFEGEARRRAEAAGPRRKRPERQRSALFAPRSPDRPTPLDDEYIRWGAIPKSWRPTHP